MEALELWREQIKWLLLPPLSPLLLLLLGLLLYRRAIGKLFAWAGLLSLYLLSTPIVAHILGSELETEAPRSGQQLLEQGAEAILVLTAGQDRFNPELGGLARPGPLSMQRLSHALQLHRETGLPIIVSGGVPRRYKEALADVAARWLRVQGQVEPLALERRSLTTWENLQFSAELLREHGIGKVALVTHAFHMPRAMQAASTHQVQALAAPFSFYAKTPPAHAVEPAWKSWLPMPDDAHRNYLLVHEYLGHLWYRLKQQNQP